MRYFIGVGLPYELQEKVSHLRSQWQHYKLPIIRFPHGVQPHITIKSPFETERTDWMQAVADICTEMPAFPIVLGGVGAFHHDVVHVLAESRQLEDLHQFITGALLDLGIHDDADRYPYTAHSTIGYSGRHLTEVQIEKIRNTITLDLDLPQSFHARAIQVFEREVTSDHYEIATEFELKR
jgi:2'-5' RNA ligase